MHSCSAPYCNNSKSKCRNKPFFNFPRDEKLNYMKDSLLNLMHNDLRVFIMIVPVYDGAPDAFCGVLRQLVNNTFRSLQSDLKMEYDIYLLPIFALHYSATTVVIASCSLIQAQVTHVQHCLQWVHACRCPDLFRKSHRELYHNCCLCGDHFTKQCITKGKVKRLIAGAVPTLFSEAGRDEKQKKRLSSEEWKDFCSREQFKQKLRLSMVTLSYSDKHSSIGTLHTDCSSLQEEINSSDQGTSEIAQTQVNDIKPDSDAGVSILPDIHFEKNVDLEVVKKEICSDDSSDEIYDVSNDEMADSRAGSETPLRAHTKENIKMSIKNEGQEFSTNERNCVTPDDEALTSKRKAKEEISMGPCFKKFKESLKLSMQCILKREECSDSGSRGSPNDSSINETSVSFTKETNMDNVASVKEEVKPGGAKEMQFKQNLERRLKSIVSKDLKISAQEKTIRGLKTKLRNLKEKMRDHEQKCTQKSFLLSQLQLYLPPNLYTVLLSQIEAASVHEKDRRWSRDFKSWAIKIYQASPKAYEVCQRLLYLPSVASMSRFVRVSASETSG